MNTPAPATASRMMLHWSPRSPFVRKVMIAAHELGLVERLDLRRTVVQMSAPNTELLADNPLSRIPTLVLADGTVLVESLVISDYFDNLAGGGRILPAGGLARWVELSRHGLASGLLEILLLWRNEREKPAERQTPAWLASFRTKYEATLARFERDIAAMAAEPFGIAQIALGCMLSYLDFRFQDLNWREGHPALAAWHEQFSARPSVRATEIVDA